MNPFNENPNKTLKKIPMELSCISCSKGCIIRESRIYITKQGRFMSMCSRCRLMIQYEYFKEVDIVANRVERIHQRFQDLQNQLKNHN